ncbi:mitochondrial branched-chain alpha-ketoacid dehydrogenase kinase-domain-containing protein, partial [Mycotypha africana]|uniref:mitochondrial branched-chain alpha-ketoacid dehydrogenase kinase-domain-containing protein n=1 Tax=Mycotypha africana TaxID=64632 RepID=UPI0023001C8D
PVTLKQLVRFGQPPITSQSIKTCTHYARSELPVRLARRVRAFQSLPFIVGTNPFIKEIYSLYYDSFEKLVQYYPSENSDNDQEFIEHLKAFVERHSDNIPTLARGFLECKQYMNTQDMTHFLDDMIQARIGIRLIAEQAISLMQQQKDDANASSGYIGIIDTQIKPDKLIRHCCDFVAELCEFHYGLRPEEAVIDGHTNTQFTYVPVHLEYILTELIKNAYRATVEHHRKMGRITNVPPIQITISQGQEDISIRIRDQGNGISEEDLPNVFDYSYTTVSKILQEQDESENDGPSGIFRNIAEMAMQSGVGGPLAGLGFGLPLARMYARYFGGSLTLVSMRGYGCDVFLKLRHIDESMAEGVEI